MDSNNEYGTYNVQKKLLILLERFHQFCVDNDIKYSLDWGSLLGAIRHKGFIPWDDDLDVMVDRTNYNKLVSLIVDNEDLELNFENPRAYWVGRVYLSGTDMNEAWIPTLDIFVVDNAPDGKVSRTLRLIEALFLQGMMKPHANFNKGGVLLRLCTIITFYLGKLFSREMKFRWYNIISQKSNCHHSRQKTCYFEEYKCLGRYYPYDLLDNTIIVPFENIEAMIVRDYHQCLCEQFGSDYMTPPPVSERLVRHKNE